VFPTLVGMNRAMLARRLTTILPAMRLAEAIDTTGIPRVAGRTSARAALATTRPCRAPPQTISEVGLMGARDKHTFHPERHSPPSPRYSWSPRPGGPGRT
jgi:predicted ATPase with chaperone activity